METSCLLDCDIFVDDVKPSLSIYSCDTTYKPILAVKLSLYPVL